jgi:hypothetical protein
LTTTTSTLLPLSEPPPKLALPLIQPVITGLPWSVDRALVELLELVALPKDFAQSGAPTLVKPAA